MITLLQWLLLCMETMEDAQVTAKSVAGSEIDACNPTFKLILIIMLLILVEILAITLITLRKL